uniref:Ankyrin repeat domain-containing protein 31 isoform X2 n=1 Tax=Petromyzon marinus TaxID=7757 RepID=A0AAJ7TV67_PETMA|nr:ankyrin repeat domain-containing protein 31 isoform X2 [Petromyzon marinus]
MSASERDQADSDSTASLMECSYDEDKWDETHLRRVQDGSSTRDEMMGEVAGIITRGDAERLSPVIAVVPKIKLNIQHWGLETNPSAPAMEVKPFIIFFSDCVAYSCNHRKDGNMFNYSQEMEEEGFSQSLFDEIISKKNVHSSEEAKVLVGVGEGMIIKPPSDREEVVQQEMEPDYEDSEISLISGNVVSVYRPLAHTSESSAAEEESQTMLQAGDCIATKKFKDSHYSSHTSPISIRFGVSVPAEDLPAVSISSESAPNTFSYNCTPNDVFSKVDISNKVSDVLGSSESTPSDIAALPTRPKNISITQKESKESSMTVTDSSDKAIDTLNTIDVDSKTFAATLPLVTIWKEMKIIYLEDAIETNVPKNKYNEKLRTCAKYKERTDSCAENPGNIKVDEVTSCSKTTSPLSCQEDTIADDASNTSCSLDVLCGEHTAGQITENNVESCSVEVLLDSTEYSNFDLQFPPEVRKSSRLARKWKDGPPTFFWRGVKNIKRETHNYVNVCNIKGETQLHFAALKGHLSKVKSLIQSGSDVNAPDYAGWTPLHVASTHGFVNVVLELVRAKARVNCRGLDDITPLHDAAKCGHWKVVQCLLENGADPRMKNAHGKTALELCQGARVQHLLSSWAKAQCADGDQTRLLVDEPARCPAGEASNEPVTAFRGSHCPDSGSKSASEVDIRQSCDVALKDHCPEGKKYPMKPGRKKGQGPSSDKQLHLIQVFKEAIKELDDIKITLQSIKSWDLSLTGKADKYKQAIQKMHLTLNTLLQRQKKDSYSLSNSTKHSSVCRAKANSELWDLLMIRKRKLLERLKTHRELSLRYKTFQQELKQQLQIQQQTLESGNSQEEQTPSASGMTVKSSDFAQVPNSIVQVEQQQTMGSSVVIPCTSENTTALPITDYAVQRDGATIVQEGNTTFDSEDVVYIPDSLISCTQTSSGQSSAVTHEPCDSQVQILAKGLSAGAQNEYVSHMSVVGLQNTPQILSVTRHPTIEHDYTRLRGQQKGGVERQDADLEIDVGAAPGEVIMRPTESQTDVTGSIPSFLSYRQLVHRGVLQPGKDVLSINVKGTVHYATLLMNGTILTPQLATYKSPMLWHKALLASNTNPKWSVTASVVLYEGRMMSSYAKRENYPSAPLAIPSIAVAVSTSNTPNIAARFAQETPVHSETQSGTKPRDVPITKYFILPSRDCDLTGCEGCQIFTYPKKVLLVQNSELCPMYYINDLFNNPDNWDFLCSEGTKHADHTSTQSSSSMECS